MEKCSLCISDYKKSFKSDHLKSVKHLEHLDRYYCEKCSLYMNLSDEQTHLGSDEHKVHHNEIWCEDCGKNCLIKQDITKAKFTT